MYKRHTGKYFCLLAEKVFSFHSVHRNTCCDQSTLLDGKSTAGTSPKKTEQFSFTLFPSFKLDFYFYFASQAACRQQGSRRQILIARKNISFLSLTMNGRAKSSAASQFALFCFFLVFKKILPALHSSVS